MFAWKTKNIEDCFKMDLCEIGCKDEELNEAAQECVQLWALIVAILNLQVLLLDCSVSCMEDATS
jgi:hypothetical protein